MNSFSLAFSVVCPLFLMMSLGFFLRRIGLFTEDFLRQLNKICFEVFLPMILFVNVYDSDFSRSFQPKLIGFAMLCAIIMFVLLVLLIPKIERENKRRGVIIQGIFRSNFILFGLPVAVSLFGEKETGVTAVLIAFMVPVFNVLSVLALEFFRGCKIDIKRIIKGVITNPLIIGAMAAFFFIITGLRLPNVIERTVRDISKIATPLALIILGGSFEFSSLRHNWKSLLLAVGGRLVIVPLVFLSLSVALGIRGIELCTLLAMFASPTAVSSFTMAQQVEADDELAGQIVVVGSIFSIITIFAWISVLNLAGLFMI